MPVHGTCHITSGRPLWSLLEEAVVELSPSGDRLTVRGRWGDVEVLDRSVVVREALHRMSMGPVALENIPTLYQNFVRWRDGLGGTCADWHRLQRTLDQIGGYVVPSLGHEDGSGPLLSLVATTPYVVFLLPFVRWGERIGLRSDAAIETVDGEQVLVCPDSLYRVALHRPQARLIVRTLMARDAVVADIADALRLDPRLVADVVSYLAGAGAVLPTAP